VLLLVFQKKTLTPCAFVLARRFQFLDQSRTKYDLILFSSLHFFSSPKDNSKRLPRVARVFFPLHYTNVYFDPAGWVVTISEAELTGDAVAEDQSPV